MSNEDKVDPFLIAEVLGKTVKIEYTMGAAILYKRLSKRPLLGGGFDVNDPDYLIPFYIAGLYRHQPEMTGEVDAEGNPDETMKALIKQFENLPTHYDAVTALTDVFMRALGLGQPRPKAADDKKKQKIKKK